MTMTDENKKTIGLVGIGRMGLAITKHLTHHGYKTIVNDLDARQCEAAARDHGSRVAGTPAEVGAAARFVIIAVGFDDEATQVVLGHARRFDCRRFVDLHARSCQMAGERTCRERHPARRRADLPWRQGRR